MKQITNQPKHRRETFHFTPNTASKYLDPTTGYARFITIYCVFMRDEKSQKVFRFSHEKAEHELLLVLSSHKVQAIYSSDPTVPLESAILLNTAGDECCFVGAALICIELEKDLWCLQYINSTVSPVKNCSIWSNRVCLTEFSALLERLGAQFHKLSLADFESLLATEMDKFCPEDEPANTEA